MIGPCPTEEVIAAFVSGNLNDEEQQAVEAHLSQCDDCCEIVAFVVNHSTERSNYSDSDL